jgi:energy-coupling factor transporter ATP-binding protein EcfA2
LPPHEVKQRVQEALAAVSLEHVAQKPPQDLSFGQKKRVALATILSMQPDFLILDEPSSNLDPLGRRQMMALIRAIESTVLIATHDLDLVWELCPRSIIIDDGRVVADGETRALLANESLLAAHGLELPAQVRYRNS